MSKVSAEVEQIVSARSWVAFPELLTAILRWTEQVKAAASDMVISAVPIGMDFISVRVTRTKGPERLPVDWIEWLAPMGYRGASQPAVDHFVARSLEAATDSLNGRTGQLNGLAEFPPAHVRDLTEDSATMAKAKATKTTTTAKRKAPKRGVATNMAGPTSATPIATKRRGVAATASKTMTMAPRAETRSSKASAPTSRKPAAPATPAKRSTKPATMTAPKPAASKTRATAKSATGTKTGRK